MVFSSYEGIGIAAIAASVPEDEYKIDLLMKNSDERMIKQIKKKTGIEKIRKAKLNQTASDLGFSAAKALESAGKYVTDDIGILLYVTQGPDYRTPSTACVLQDRLNLNKSCIALGALAKSIRIRSEELRVGKECTLGRGRTGEREEDSASNTRFLFGDAASAILIERQKESIIHSALMTDGSGFRALVCPYGAWKHPVGPELCPGDDLAVFSFAINEVPELINNLMKRINTNVNDYDALILHQANMMIMKQIAKKINMPMEKVPISLNQFGNTSGASVPLTIVNKYGEENEGNIRLLTSGFGVGLSWGVLSFDINKKDILPLIISKDVYDDNYPDYYSTEEIV